MRARLIYQTRKRGTLESDLLLSTFAKDELDKMSEVEMKEFDKVSHSFHNGTRHLLIDNNVSFWTRQTGTSITGRQERERLLNVGPTRRFLKD